MGFLGVGLDNEDGHQRLTRGENFVLYGGSQETHERMTDTAVDVNDQLRKRGKTLPQATIDELLDMFRAAQTKRTAGG